MNDLPDNPWESIDDLMELDGSFAGRRTILERYREMLKRGWTPTAEEVLPLVEIILKEVLGGEMQALSVPDISDCDTCIRRSREQMELLAAVKCESIDGLICEECGREYNLFIAEEGG